MSLSKTFWTYLRLYPFHTTGPVLGSQSDVRMRPCELVVNHPLSHESYGSFRLFKMSVSDFVAVGMRRRFCT